MLPKVATQLIHHTTRAVAAVQGSGHAFRNVLQSSSSGTTTTVNWSGVGTSGSGWSSAGTGAGGAKYQSSSKFYHGYQGAGRSLTQASQASTIDSGPNQADDTDDPFPRHGSIGAPSRPLTNVRRPRSHSLVLSSKGQVENTKTDSRPGVLEVVRVHVRANHAFATHNGAIDEATADSTPPQSRPKLSRRASTSSVTSSPHLDDVSPSLSHSQSVILPSDSSAPEPFAPQIEDPATQIRAKLSQYSNERNHEACAYVKGLLENKQLPQDSAVYEAAIRIVADTYQSKFDISLLKRLFDETVKRSLSLSSATHRTLILAFLKRDLEITTAAAYHQERVTGSGTGDRAFPKHRDLDLKANSSSRSEPNFRHAVRIFQAAKKAGTCVPSDVYTALLYGCVRHQDEHAALRVFAYLEEEHGTSVPHLAYFDMMRLYSVTKNIAAAEVILSGLKKASELGNVSYPSIPAPGTRCVAPVEPWNLMIDIYLSAGRQTEALSILETMLDSSGSSGSSVPPPTLSTFHTIIAGFCRGNDFETALKWFRRLLQETTVIEDPSAPLHAPPRPDARMWGELTDAMAKRRMLDEINSLYVQWLPTSVRDHRSVVGAVRQLVFHANIAHLDDLQERKGATSSHVKKKVDHVVEKIVGDPHDWISTMGEAASDTMHKIIKLYVRDGRFEKAIKFLQTYIAAHRAVVGIPRAGGELPFSHCVLLRNLCHRVLDVTEWILRRQDPPPFAISKIFVSVTNSFDSALSADAAETYLSLYEASKERGQIDQLTIADAEALIAAGVRVIYTNKQPADGQPGSHPLVRFETLLADIAEWFQDLSELSPTAIDGVLRGLQTWYPVESLQAVLEKLGKPWSALWSQSLVQERILPIPPTPASDPTADTRVGAPRPSTPPPGSDATTYRISTRLSREIDERLDYMKAASPIKAYEKFLQGFVQGYYPTAGTFGKLINALGRARDIEKVNFVYRAAQHSLTINTPPTSENPEDFWYQIEDHMIIALAHAGDAEGAHSHRLGILEYGSAPSADAYGALISCVKDTTDDSANAYSLYRESQIRGVVPNVYLYNTMISKLAKARKADLAMELFSRMKENGFRPSSVSYGAVIGACSRVGDVESAEALFEEMSSQENFKPRVPPFNTMMQLYTYTKRNREKVLHYYDSMVSAGVYPTAHTYKLLMDAYGTIEPVDITAMEQTFETLCADKSVQVLGTHWGSLINAYGCVRKDLDRAIEVFESIASHPSTRTGGLMPDAVSYEALINVFVTLRRTDLIPVYVERFQSSGVHMTAYIANLLIKGYAVVGELGKARGVFESLVDPPTGIAATNNHAPHEFNTTAQVHPDAPVYREPSTWEAMVRAELGNGNREEAVTLLERMQARQFPAAVCSRISGIMLDGAVSPWPVPSQFAPE